MGKYEPYLPIKLILIKKYNHFNVAMVELGGPQNSTGATKRWDIDTLNMIASIKFVYNTRCKKKSVVEDFNAMSKVIIDNIFLSLVPYPLSHTVSYIQACCVFKH